MRDLDDAEVLEIAIVENIQRADLNAMEEAGGYQQLMERFGHTQQALAQALGKSRSHVANLLRLLALPKAVQDLVRSGDLSAGHARALVTAADPEALAQDDRARRRPRPRGRRRPEKDADTRAAERDLAAALGMKVSIDHVADGEAGTVTFRYGSLEQLDELCRRVLAGPLRQGMEERLLDHASSFAGAHHVLKDYDGSTMAVAAEKWAERHLGMVKAERGTAGFDGTLPDGRKLQVKSKKHGAHSDAGTYITLSSSTFELADDVLVVFVDDAPCAVERVVGPVPVRSLSPRHGRIYVSDMIASQDRAALPVT